MPKNTILIVDDDDGLRDALADYLELESFDILSAADVASARAHLSQLPDLILLDLTMPGGDGLSFAREIRSQILTTIIIMSGKGDTIDRVVGLEVGADDYLPKPFELREMLARIRALLRRSSTLGRTAHEGQSAPAAGRSAQFGGCLVLIPGQRQVMNQSGALIDLTRQE